MEGWCEGPCTHEEDFSNGACVSPDPPHSPGCDKQVARTVLTTLLVPGRELHVFLKFYRGTHRLYRLIPTMNLLLRREENLARGARYRWGDSRM